mmetsp:Transcript_37928/g.111297  ORF Transcript_37928/g.111297 Transcript_37928/m.111297 type:complete len:207 (-) Transcript_37928:272-892(-)
MRPAAPRRRRPRLQLRSSPLSRSRCAAPTRTRTQLPGANAGPVGVTRACVAAGQVMADAELRGAARLVEEPAEQRPECPTERVGRVPQARGGGEGHLVGREEQDHVWIDGVVGEGGPNSLEAHRDHDGRHRIELRRRQRRERRRSWPRPRQRRREDREAEREDGEAGSSNRLVQARRGGEEVDEPADRDRAQGVHDGRVHEDEGDE